MSNVLTMTATEAGRRFSKLLRLVENGARVRITSRGRTVAVIDAPDAEDDGREAERKAWDAMEAHWATMEPVTVGPWTRAELYERDGYWPGSPSIPVFWPMPRASIARRKIS